MHWDPIKSIIHNYFTDIITVWISKSAFCVKFISSSLSASCFFFPTVVLFLLGPGSSSLCFLLFESVFDFLSYNLKHYSTKKKNINPTVTMYLWFQISFPVVKKPSLLLLRSSFLSMIYALKTVNGNTVSNVL